MSSERVSLQVSDADQLYLLFSLVCVLLIGSVMNIFVIICHGQQMSRGQPGPIIITTIMDGRSSQVGNCPVLPPLGLRGVDLTRDRPGIAWRNFNTCQWTVWDKYMLTID